MESLPRGRPSDLHRIPLPEGRTLENHTTPTAIPETPQFDGTWERSGRSPNVAAVAGLLGVGIVYFYGQAIVMTVVIMAMVGLGSSFVDGDGYFHHVAKIVDLIRTPLRIVLIFSQFFLMLLPVLWMVRRWHSSRVRSYIRLRPCSIVQVVLACAAAIFLFPLNVALSQFFADKLNVPEELRTINEGLFSALSTGEFIFVLFAIAVTPAICEEVFFRGYVQRTFERTLGWKSILLVGVLFGLFHMQPLGLLFLSGLGFVFGFFYFASKSLLPGMVAHCTNNAIAVSWLYWSGARRVSGIRFAMVHNPAVVVLAFVFAAATLYVFWIVSRRRSTVETGSPNPEKIDPGIPQAQ